MNKSQEEPTSPKSEDKNSRKSDIKKRLDKYYKYHKANKPLTVASLFGGIATISGFLLLIHYFLSIAHLLSIGRSLGISSEHISQEDFYLFFLRDNYNFLLYAFVTPIVYGFMFYLLYPFLYDKRVESTTRYLVPIGSVCLIAIFLKIYDYYPIFAVVCVLIIIFSVFLFISTQSRKPIFIWCGAVTFAIFMATVDIREFKKNPVIYSYKSYVELEFNDNTIVTTNDTVRMAYHGSKYVIFRNIPDSTSTLYSTNSIKRITEKANFYPAKQN